MKNVQVTINPTEIKSINYSNTFSKKPGEKISLSIKSEAQIKLTPNNPVVAIISVNTTVEDPDGCIAMQVETITGVQVSTYIDNLDQFIKRRYLPVIIMAANEKVRNLSAVLGAPIRLPNPNFTTEEAGSDEFVGLTQ